MQGNRLNHIRGYMRNKRIAAASLCTILLFGFSGCDVFNVRKGMSIMAGELQIYQRALITLDYQAIRDISDWNEGDSDYQAIEELFDTSYYGDEAGRGYVECVEYIASTIHLVYDIDDIEGYYYTATLDVTYEMVDWPQVYAKHHKNYYEVLNDLKSCEDKRIINTKITFENVDEQLDWRLCRLNDIDNVMRFMHTIPDIDSPVESEAGNNNIGAINTYSYWLKSGRSEIERTEALFKIQACGVYDFNTDGIPELYYITEDREDKSGMLRIRRYPDSSRDITITNFINIEHDDEYSVFMTDKELVIVYGYSEGQTFCYSAEIYDFDLHPITSYYCARQYDYDPLTDTDSLVTKCIRGESDELTEDEFMSEVHDYTGRAQLVLLGNYKPFDDSSFENVPATASYSCEDMLLYLKSLK